MDSRSSVVWTGTELLVWAGPRSSARYDPAANAWKPVSAVGALGQRKGSTAVWAGDRLLVWGGEDATGAVLGDGAAYDPKADSWAPLLAAGAPSPRAWQTAIWTGRAMVVWGGRGAGGDFDYLGDGARYDPIARIWTPLSTDGAPSPRRDHSAVWTGREMIIWGGTGHTGAVGDGATYDPDTNSWHPLPLAGAPGPRLGQSAAWTGHQMIIWGGANNSLSGFNDGAAYTPLAPHDNRYFSQTGYRIDNDVIWDYFNRRGGLPTFGYPTSRTFLFRGFTVQFFQRRIVQLDPQGKARQLNLLDPGLLPYTSFNGSTFPGVDQNLVGQAPDPTNQPATLAFVKQHAPDSYQGAPVNFYRTFIDTVTPQVAFPNGDDPSLVPRINLEMWGVPTSGPLVDPNNHTFIYLRWQRRIMLHDGSRRVTEGILLADELKAILTGQNLPPDVDQESRNSPFYKQVDPSQPKWVRDPSLLPDTDLTDAFTRE